MQILQNGCQAAAAAETEAAAEAEAEARVTKSVAYLRARLGAI